MIIVDNNAGGFVSSLLPYNFMNSRLKNEWKAGCTIN